MIQPPSKALIDQLTQLRLCRRGDLRRARKRVKALAGELPAFDSVWIDALLQGRQLTPYQANCFENGTAANLAIGPCVLLDQLGRGPISETYLARHRDDRRRSVLKVLTPPDDQSALVAKRLHRLAEATRAPSNDHVVAPRHLAAEEDRLVLLSDHVDGIPLTELLIRRGRFPAAIVRALGRQLIAGLATLESAAELHGDITLWNTRLTAAGKGVLVDAGVATAVAPEIIIRPDTPPERYDGIAPERIATGEPATTRSDVYALGCLLWHLLAGRPVFPTGDSLTKLAHHQTRPVPDVCEWAPDTPSDLAEAISKMTALDPAQRPSSFAELAELWGRPNGTGRRRLRRFHSAFRTTVPRITTAGAGSGMIRATVLTLTASMLLLAVGLFEIDIRTPLMRVTAPIRNVFVNDESPVEDDDPTEAKPTETVQPKPDNPDRRIELPPPDRNGVITLSTAGPYLWNRTIRSQSPLTIRGVGKQRPVVLITPAGGRVDASSVLLNNLEFTPADEKSATPLKLQCGQLTIQGCRFTHPASDNSKSVAVLWAAKNKADVRNAIHIEQTVFSGRGFAIGCIDTPTRIDCKDVLLLNGTLLRFSRLPSPGRVCAVSLRNSTLRNARSLLDVGIPDSNAPGRIAVDARDCVFHLRKTKSALCLFRSNFPGRFPKHLVQWTGEGSLVLPGTNVAGDATDGAAIEDSKTVVIDGGLIAGPFDFAGKATKNPADSIITRHRAPRRGGKPPGITGNK